MHIVCYISFSSGDDDSSSWATVNITKCKNDHIIIIIIDRICDGIYDCIDAADERDCGEFESG